jgi:hypothetical protein
MSLTDSQATNIEAFKIALDVCQQRNIEVSEEIKVIAHDPATHINQLNQLSDIDPTFKILMQEANQLLKTQQKLERDQHEYRSDNPLVMLDARHFEPIFIPARDLEIPLLKALEKNRLNVRDLAFTLDQPLDRTQQIVQTIWQDGFIDALTASPVFIIFPGLRSAAYRQRKVSTNTLLTLTSKGYFSLYPMLKSRESNA